MVYDTCSTPTRPQLIPVVKLVRKDRSSAYYHAAGLDEFLGDPMVAGTPYSYREIIAREELPGVPDGTRELVETWRYHEFLVPVELGGRLRSLDEVFLLGRTISRRNLNIAAMFGSAMLAATPVWLSGSAAQKRALADEFLDGGLACFGVSEPDHGSDLRATETVLRREGQQLRLTGTKWPVGNAIRGRFVTTLAKSGTAALSLVLVDKAQLPEDRWSALPFVRMAGLKRHDVSGIEFRDAPLPCDAFVGPAGTGLAQVLKSLQITRIITGAMSLGTMDATLRIALGYTRERRLYGGAVIAIPVIQDQLVQAHLDLLISECTALPVSRAPGVAPERISLWSSVVKYLVPVTAERVIASMAVVLGARAYLCEGVADGAFQMLQRDHAMASVFEGTTHVNLQLIAAQLPAIAAHHGDFDGASADGLLRQLFSQDEDAPGWAPDGRNLRLANGGLDEITQAWPLAVQSLARIAGNAGAPTVCAELLALCHKVTDQHDAFYRGIRGDDPPGVLSVQAAQDAITHCILHAISSCVWMWIHNRAGFGGKFADGEWLVLCLQRLLRQLGVVADVDARYEAVFTEHMLHCAAEGAGCSLISLAQARDR